MHRSPCGCTSKPAFVALERTPSTGACCFSRRALVPSLPLTCPSSSPCGSIINYYCLDAAGNIAGPKRFVAVSAAASRTRGALLSTFLRGLVCAVYILSGSAPLPGPAAPAARPGLLAILELLLSSLLLLAHSPLCSSIPGCCPQVYTAAGSFTQPK